MCVFITEVIPSNEKKKKRSNHLRKQKFLLVLVCGRGWVRLRVADGAGAESSRGCWASAELLINALPCSTLSLEEIRQQRRSQGSGVLTGFKVRDKITK